MTLVESKQVTETVQSAFNFSVDKFPLSGPDNLRTPYYGLFRSDNKQVVGRGSKTKKYVPHTTEDVLALCDAAKEAFDDEIAVACHFDHGHYVSIQPTHASRRAIYGEKDNIFPRMVISAGYDGKSFKAMMGYWRDACINLSMLRRVRGTCVSIRHTSALRDKMDDLIASFQLLKESWGTLGDVIDELEAADVNLSNFLNSIYGLPDADSQREVTIHRNRTEEIFNRLRRERLNTGRGPMPTDNVVTAWEAYNAVQGYVQHKATRKQGTTDFGRIIKAHNDPRVKAAEKEAFELAGLAA